MTALITTVPATPVDVFTPCATYPTKGATASHGPTEIAAVSTCVSASAPTPRAMSHPLPSPAVNSPKDDDGGRVADCMAKLALLPGYVGGVCGAFGERR